MAGARVGLLAAAASVALAAGAAVGADAPASPGTVTAASSAASNQAAAGSDAASLLASLALPPGATQSSTEPAGDASHLAQPATYPATPNLVDDHAWWTASGTRQAVLAYIDAHRPAGSTPSVRGSLSGEPALGFEGYRWPPITGVLGSRELIVEAVQLPDGSTGLRADSEVVWLIPRPASERIPTGARRLSVMVNGAYAGQRPHQRPLLFTSRRKIERVVALLNGLPLGQPGTASCPSDLGIRVRLAFYARRGVPPLALADVNTGGCGDVQVKLGDQQQPPLSDEPFPGSGRPPTVSLIHQLDSALGVKLNINPPLFRSQPLK